MNITTTYPYINVTNPYTPEINYISIYTTFLFYGYVLFMVRMCIQLYPLTLDEFNPFDDLFLTDEKVVQDLTVTPEKYSEKYKKEYSQLIRCDLSDDRLSILKNSVIIENTPVGSVLMYYKYNEDDKSGMFHYYSNNTISYCFLEVVARKYVVTFNCKRLYVGGCDEEPVKSLQEETPVKCFTICEPPSKSVFVKFKNYNTGTILNKTQSVTDINETSVKRMNIFKSKGRLANFNFLKKVDRKLVDANYSMTFSDYKKMVSS